MKWTELNALLKYEISATRNCKRVTANCGLRFAVCLMLKISITCETYRIDSQSVTSILCVSQVMSQKAVLSFYKSMSPPPSQPNTMLKDQRNCALTVSTHSVGLGGGGRDVQLVARGYNFACVKKRSNCTTVPRLLSMIVALVTNRPKKSALR